MPYKRSTPEELEFARKKQREYSAKYRSTPKGQKAHANGQARYYAAHKDDINLRNRGVCIVCGGPKEPGRGFRKCNTCWGVREEKDLDALIAEQEQDLFLDTFQPPQRFGDHSSRESTVLPLDWRDDLPEDIWSDPTADEAIHHTEAECEGGCEIHDR